MLDALMKELEEVRRRKSSDYVREFEELLARIAALQDPQSIPALVALLEDDAEYDEVMFSIVHTIEAFDDSTYVDQVIASLPGLNRTAPRWSAIIHKRVLNSSETMAAYGRRAKEASPVERGAIRKVLTEVAKTPVFRDRVNALLGAIPD
jgi:hypothetical protein